MEQQLIIQKIITEPEETAHIFENIMKQHELKIDPLTLDLVDSDFLNEVQTVIKSQKVGVYFGKTIRDLKLVLQDEELREHEVFFQYKAPRNLLITAVNLPSTCLQCREFSCVESIIHTFSNCINEMGRYFFELEHIDNCCTVIEPVNPTFKHDYRRLLIDERMWLHVEVTLEGLATNIHLVGKSDHWNNKLQKGLLSWDHDKNIVDNIMNVFDLSEFPKSAVNLSAHEMQTENKSIVEEIVCGICLCLDLPDAGVPQPLCQNPTCGVYYHRSCLYQWLVACAGNRPPAFGVANGECPTCLQLVTCSEKDI